MSLALNYYNRWHAIKHAFSEHALANAGKNGKNLDSQSAPIKGSAVEASKCSKSARNKKDHPPGHV
jgi:hypothetical protein